MAEGLLTGPDDAEDDGTNAAESVEATARGEAYAAAIAAEHARYDPDVARAAAEFLRDQSRLLKEQAAGYAEDQRLRVSHLHAQAREGKLRRIGQRIRIFMQVVTALVAGTIGAGLAIMIHDAFTSHYVVVNAFHAPAALAGRGLTGDVLAAGVLDGLQTLQTATRGAETGLASAGAWASEVKINVPETGISIGEVNRLLHERFGHDIHIDGALVQTEAGGLALTVRGDGVPARTFAGAAGALDALTTQAADYIYSRSQPLLYVVYLQNAGRYNEALQFLPGAYARAPDDPARAVMANEWGNAYVSNNQPAQAIAKYRLSMSLRAPRSPPWWSTWVNIIGALASLADQEEEAWRQSRELLQAAARAPAHEKPEVSVLGNAAQITWDLPLLLASQLADTANNGGAGSSSVVVGLALAETAAMMHDRAAVERYLAGTDPQDATVRAETQLLAGYAALDANDAAAAIAPLEAFDKAWLSDTNLQYTDPDNPCFLAFAYGVAGRAADAEALFRRMGHWSRCAALHGDALARAGDVAGARRVWAEALARAPDLPMVYLHRGQFELDHGDLAAAAADFTVAHDKAPHFADPLKGWGDVLSRQGRWSAALDEYSAALVQAPAWPELRQARDMAAARAGSPHL